MNKEQQKAKWTFSKKDWMPQKDDEEPSNPILSMPGFKQLVLKASLKNKQQKLIQANDAVFKLKQTLANKNKMTLNNAQ